MVLMLRCLKLIGTIGGITVIGLMSACSTTKDMLTISEVKPWERGILAREDMQLVNDTMQQSVDDHIYYSKEGSTGGASIQGGGCGCN